MFIISIRYTRQEEEVQEILPQHVEFLDQYFSSGVFFCAGSQVSPPGRVILARSASLEQLETIMRDDPFYRSGVGDFSILEFEPTHYSQQFTALLDS